MKKQLKKVVALSMVVGLCASSAFLVKEKHNQAGKLYAGIGYVAAKNGASPEAGLAIGVIGVVDSAVQGAAFGAAFGGPVGVIAGAAVGL